MMKTAKDRMEGTQRFALQTKEISKCFGSTVALDSVSLDLRYGTVHALLGENGAGKTTFVSSVYGLVPPDSGTIAIDEKEIRIHSPAEALSAGIGLVQQHFALIPAFTVLDNLILGHEPGWWGAISRKSAADKIQQLLGRYDLSIPLNKRVDELTVGECQRVEIARILYRNARIMLFDEPAAALVSSEIDQFLKTLITLKEQGIAILLITHRLPEVMQAADEITVLRRGKVVLQKGIHDTNENEIAASIIGDQCSSGGFSLPAVGNSLLSVFLQDEIKLSVNKSEIVGIAGVAGNGQEEFIDSLLGIHSDGQ